MKDYYKKNKQKINNYSKKYKENNIEKINEYYRTKYKDSSKRQNDAKENTRKRRLKKYGITEIEYNELLEKQDHKCAICLNKEKITMKNGISRKLSIDHDHITGKVRALLCRNCNVAIGLLQDNPYLCQRAGQYLLDNTNNE